MAGLAVLREAAQDLVVVLSRGGQRRSQAEPPAAQLDRHGGNARLAPVGQLERDHAAAGIEVRVVEEVRWRLDAREGQAALFADALELRDGVLRQELRDEGDQ